MFSSLRFRLWLTYALVVGVVICIAGAVVTVFLLRNPAEDRRELQRLRLLSSIMLQRNQIFNLSQRNLTQPFIQDILERADRTSGVRVAIFDTSGKLLADSRSSQAGELPDWSTLSKKPLASRQTFVDSAGKQWLYSIAPLEGGNYLLLATPRPRLVVLGILRDEFLGPFLRGAILALLLSLLLAFWIAHWITRPLERIAKATHSVSGGDFRKIPLEGPDEVQTLANAFNAMGERVQSSQRSQRDFIANVSHDLKTPLTSIQGFAQAILDGTAGDASAVKQAAGVIYAEAERMYRMVLDLLELARLDSGVVKLERLPLNLPALLRNIVEKFTPLARQTQVDLKLLVDDSLFNTSPVVLGDVDRLAQAFTNLVDNAIKYTPQAGQVSVRVQSVDSWMEVRVVDMGPGIPPDEQDRIFERFYQTDKSRRGGDRRGVGLGLAIAREIVHAHGGTISVYDRQDVGGTIQPGSPGAGSVFLVRLPLAPPDTATPVGRRKEIPPSKP